MKYFEARVRFIRQPGRSCG